jgi:4-hydroxy-tetrahydrodipicolinate synthase
MDILAPRAVPKPFRGIFAILQTPFRLDDEVDEEDLEREVSFCVRAGAPGLIWPQVASEFYALSEEERMRVAEIILRAGAGRIAVVIGVQALNKALAVRFARHAEEKGADAVISLPPFLGPVTLDAAADYFRALAGATRLPTFIQNTGGQWGPALPTSLVIQLAKENHRLSYVKEEVAPVVHRLEEYVRSGVMTGIFSGDGGRNLFNDLARGSSGTTPACGFVDVDVQIYNLATTGKTEEARALFKLLLPMKNLQETYGLAFAKRVLVRRGVFKTAKLRGVTGIPLDATDEQDIDVWWRELAPYLKV